MLRTLRFYFFIFTVLFPGVAWASTTDGTIDAAYHYAWSENAGWIDFGSSAGNVHVADTILTGSVYGENIGWLTLNPQTYGGVTNDAAGNLSGYAWGENVGWVDFSRVTIGSDGIFAGSAYSENIGWITFGTGDNKVMTDWRPASGRVPPPAISMGGVFSMPSPSVVAAPYQSTAQKVEPVVPAVPAVPTTPTPLLSTPSAPVNFTAPTSIEIPSKNLVVGSRDQGVKALQKFLNTQGFVISKTGNGSLGNETEYFGTATQKALSKFQAENGIYPANGYFGPITKRFIENISQNIKIASPEVTIMAPPLPANPSNLDVKPVPQALPITPIIMVDTKPIFTRDLTLGTYGSDVLELQKFLITRNSGSASRSLAENAPTEYFGPITQAALIEFQEHNNITPARGYFGPKTITFIKNLESNP
ncbi:MAG: peptidoglycan-binding protein [Candidatus Paceibacterota bacterium]